MTSLIQLSQPPSPVVDVVFVHGLGGDALETWGFGSNNCWTTWLEASEPGSRIWTYGYDASISHWTGSSMPLYDRALSLLAHMEERGLGDIPICFITHSMGGLVVKQALRHAHTMSKEYEKIVLACKTIVFIATPQGSTNS